MANQQQNQRQQAPSGGGDFIAEPANVGLPWRLMIFTFILLLFAILLFAGLKFGYITYLDDQIEATDLQMEDLAAQVSEGEKERFLTFYSQLVNLKKVLDRRSFSQNLFSLMESNTLGSVYYTNVEYSEDRLSAILSGRAESMEDFVNQMTVFGDSDEIDKAVLQDLTLSEGEVNFSVNILLDSQFLNEPQQ